MSEWSERFKLALHERIKKGTVEVDANGERILLKKGRRKYRIIMPPVIEEDGKLKMMWANFLFGGWFNLFKLFGIMIIFAFVFWSVHGLFLQYNSIVNNTCVQNCLTNIPNFVANNFTYPLA